MIVLATSVLTLPPPESILVLEQLCLRHLRSRMISRMISNKQQSTGKQRTKLVTAEDGQVWVTRWKKRTSTRKYPGNADMMDNGQRTRQEQKPRGQPLHLANTPTQPILAEAIIFGNRQVVNTKHVICRYRFARSHGHQREEQPRRQQPTDAEPLSRLAFAGTLA